MKTNQLKLPGAILAAVLLLATVGCHSNGMPQTGNTADSTNSKNPDNLTNGQTNSRGDTIRTDSGKRRMDSVR